MAISRELFTFLLWCPPFSRLNRRSAEIFYRPVHKKRSCFWKNPLPVSQMINHITIRFSGLFNCLNKCWPLPFRDSKNNPPLWNFQPYMKKYCSLPSNIHSPDRHNNIEFHDQWCIQQYQNGRHYLVINIK